MATIKRTGGADFPDKLKALVAGPPKSGKTTLLGTVPNIIIADTEPRANNLASLAHLNIPYITVNSSADLRELLMVLGNDTLRAQAAADAGMTSIDAVGIDTMDTLQKLLKKERMEEQRTTQFLRDDWGWLKDEMIKIIEAFTSLPLHVIFTVHLKTQDIGTEKNPQSKILPGLEGAIASEIAGMVGYSLRSFRKEEFDAASGNRYTKYWLQAEGDETYDFLGTRTAGRLPAVIEPDFGTIYQAAMAGRPAPTQQVPVQMPAAAAGPGQVPAQAPVVQQQPQAPQQQAQQAPAQAAPPQAPVAQQPAQQPVQQPAQQQPVQQPPAQTGGPDSGPPASAPQAAPQAQQQAQQPPQAPPSPTSRADDGEPVNDVALQHVKKVYDAVGLAFPEAKLRAVTLGDARTLVKMWQAIQADAAEGKMPEGHTAQGEMTQYIEAVGLLPDAGDAQEPEKTVEPKLGGTIPEAKAYVGDSLERANEAFEYERTNGNRKTLMDWLESKGARHGGGAPQQEANGVPQAPVEVQTPVQNAAPEPVSQEAAPVTPAAPAVDVTPTDEQAVQAIQEGLGPVAVVSETINPDAQCADCGKQIDDTDIAKLSKTRFGKVLCVDDYIAATRA